MNYIAGFILFIIGILILLWGSYYGGLAWKQEVPPSLIGGLIYVSGLCLVVFSIHLFGVAPFLSFVIGIIILAISHYIVSLWEFFQEQDFPMVDFIVMTILWLLFIGVLIYAYYGAKVSGVEGAIESLFKGK